jgi:hypothetical protein
MLWLDAETVGELNFRIAVAPAQEIDDVERFDLAKQFAAAVLFGAPERLNQQGEGLEAFGDFFRAIDDFSDADDYRDAVFGDRGGSIRHFLFFTFSNKADLILRDARKARSSG